MGHACDIEEGPYSLWQGRNIAPIVRFKPMTSYRLLDKSVSLKKLKTCAACTKKNRSDQVVLSAKQMLELVIRKY